MSGRTFAADRTCSGVVLFGGMALVATFAKEGLAGWLEVFSGVWGGGGVSVEGGCGHGGCVGKCLLVRGRSLGGRRSSGSGWFCPLHVVG